MVETKTMRELRGMTLRDLSDESGFSIGGLSMHESGKQPLPPARERELLHSLALGERSAIEQEHDSDPAFVVGVEILGPPARIVRDASRRMPCFRDPKRAELLASILRDSGHFPIAGVIPAWGDFIGQTIAQQLEAEGVEDDELADRAAERAYIVEAACESAADADEFTGQLAVEVAKDMEAAVREAAAVAAAREADKED